MIQRLKLLFVVSLMLILAGCKATESAKNTAQVRILHASPETESLLLKVSSGDTKVSSVATGTTSAYVTLDAASTVYEIRSVTDNTLLATRTTGLNGGSRYTLIISGRRSALVTAFVEEDTINPASANFRFRVQNFANVGAVDTYLVAQTSDVPASTVTLAGAGSNSGTAFLEQAAGSFQVVLTTAGTKDIVYESAKQTFTGNTSYTFAVVPGKSAKLANLTLLTFGETGTATVLPNLRSRVRAIHASPDAPLLAFNNNAANMFSNVPYKANSSYTTSTSGDRTMSLAAIVSGSLSTVVSKTISLTGGEDYTLVAADRFSAIDLVRLADDNLPPITGKARVRFVNMSQDAGAVDVLVNFAKTFSSIGFKGASTYAELDAGTYTLGFNASNTSAGIASTAATLLETGKIYTVLLLGPVASVDTKIITDN